MINLTSPTSPFAGVIVAEAVKVDEYSALVEKSILIVPLVADVIGDGVFFNLAPMIYW